MINNKFLIEDEKEQFDGNVDNIIGNINENYIEQFAAGKNAGSVSNLDTIQENSRSSWQSQRSFKSLSRFGSMRFKPTSGSDFDGPCAARLVTPRRKLRILKKAE